MKTQSKPFVTLYVILSLFVTFTVSCKKSDNAKVIKVDLSNDSEIGSLRTESDIPLQAAVAAMISPEENFFYYTRIFDYISQKMDKEIIFKQRKTYREVNALLESRELDFAFICSGAYVDAKEDFGAQILVIPQVDGETNYQAYIIARSDSDFEKIEDLRDSSFAFTDPLSNTGCLYPRYLIKSMNVSEDNYFSRTLFTYAHDFSIQAVENRLVEAASVDSIIFDYIKVHNPHKVDKLKIIKTSEPFGMPPVVIHPDIEPSISERLKMIFIEMINDPLGKEILDHLNIDRFVQGKDEDYASIRKMKSVLEDLRDED